MANNTDTIDLPNLPPLSHLTFSELHITEQDVEDQLKTMNINKPAGPDCLHPIVIKNLSSSLTKPLTILFNKSLHMGVVPNAWKVANVKALYKGKGDSSDPSNYRPIAITSCISKLLERIVFKYVFNFVHDHKIISNHQSGFQPNDSTINQLLSIYHTIISNLDKGKELRFVFCDISKAFDRVWHKGLLYKLESYGIKGSILKWFESYLTDRQQSVTVEGFKSNLRSLNAGVPQGSVLGPFLFLLFINDITNQISSNIKLFADDTSLFVIVDDIDASTSILNDDLESIHSWSRQWNINFNPDKTVSLKISRCNTTHPLLYFNDHPVAELTKHKHLGIIINSKGTWSDHIQYIYENLKRLQDLIFYVC